MLSREGDVGAWVHYMFRLLWPSSGWQIDNKTCKQLYFGMRLVYGGGGVGVGWGYEISTIHKTHAKV